MLWGERDHRLHGGGFDLKEPQISTGESLMKGDLDLDLDLDPLISTGESLMTRNPV